MGNVFDFYAPGAIVQTPKFTQWVDPNGQNFKWKQFPIPYFIEPGCPAIVEPAFLAAVAKWNAAIGSNKITVVKSKKRLQAINSDTGITIGFRPNGWVNSIDTLAQSEQFCGVAPNTAQMMAIIFNGQYAWHAGDPWWVSASTKPPRKAQVDIRRVMLHELGRCLGFGTSQDPNSVMYLYLHQTEDTLSPDDVAGAKALYG